MSNSNDVQRYNDGYASGRNQEKQAWNNRFATKYRRMYAQHLLDATIVTQEDLVAFLKLADEMGAKISIVEEETKVDILIGTL